MSEARVRVSLTDGVLEFEGPEPFVAAIVEKFAGVIQTALGSEQPDAHVAGGDEGSDRVAATPPAAVAQPAETGPPAPDVSLSDIFAETEGGVQVLRVLRGANKAARTVTLAKLYLYGLQKLKHRDTAFFAEIAHVCRAHGCYNSHNMAAYLKADRASFIFGGTAKRQTLKLSAPGMEETAALIARIRAAGHGIGSRAQGIDARAQGIAADAPDISGQQRESA